MQRVKRLLGSQARVKDRDVQTQPSVFASATASVAARRPTGVDPASDSNPSSNAAAATTALWPQHARTWADPDVRAKHDLLRAGIESRCAISAELNTSSALHCRAPEDECMVSRDLHTRALCYLVSPLSSLLGAFKRLLAARLDSHRLRCTAQYCGRTRSTFSNHCTCSCPCHRLMGALVVCRVAQLQSTWSSFLHSQDAHNHTGGNFPLQFCPVADAAQPMCGPGQMQVRDVPTNVSLAHMRTVFLQSFTCARHCCVHQSILMACVCSAHVACSS